MASRTARLHRLLREGRIRYDETFVTGIEQQFDALLALLGGGPQLGKLVVAVRGSWPTTPFGRGGGSQAAVAEVTAA